jgi:4-diphosphocytidyl-2-C-methyl-D-erythritol kinase
VSITAFHDLPAPAKLNLFLHVVGRRADGYHLLQSVFVLIDWADTLHIELRRDGSLSREDLNVPLPPDDLCLKAARALQAAAGTTLGAHIAIDKQVPAGAGLGGGSSDAATTLLALNRLWGLRWPRPRLLALAATLGADVPFFVGGHNAWVEGIGERLAPITFAPQRFDVLKPPHSIPTSAIFGDPLLARDTKPATISDFLADPQRFGRNDLQASACRYSTQVVQALQLLEEQHGSSRMSGSGSAVFAWAGSGSGKPAAHAQGVSGAVAGLGEASGEAWVRRMCRSLAEHPLRHWADDEV